MSLDDLNPVFVGRLYREFEEIRRKAREAKPEEREALLAEALRLEAIIRKAIANRKLYGHDG